MRKFLFFTCLGLISHVAMSQTAIYYELGKNGFVHNVALDHVLKESHFGVRAFTGSNLGRINIAFLVGGGAFFLTGKTRHFLETGIDLAYFRHDERSDDQIGIGLVYPDGNVSTLYPSANIGYRYTGRKTIFRIGVSPGVIQSEFIPGGYVSFGFRIR